MMRVAMPLFLGFALLHGCCCDRGETDWNIDAPGKVVAGGRASVEILGTTPKDGDKKALPFEWTLRERPNCKITFEDPKAVSTEIIVPADCPSQKITISGMFSSTGEKTATIEIVARAAEPTQTASVGTTASTPKPDLSASAIATAEPAPTYSTTGTTTTNPPPANSRPPAKPPPDSLPPLPSARECGGDSEYCVRKGSNP